jgi:hypothetical protein
MAGTLAVDSRLFSSASIDEGLAWLFAQKSTPMSPAL